MKEKLTAEKLEEYGFSGELVDRFIGNDNEKDPFINPLINFEAKVFASNIKGLIYSGDDFWRGVYLCDHIQFPFNDLNLIPDYFKQGLEVYLQQKKKDLGVMFNEVDTIERFKQSEISRYNDAIKENAKFIRLPSFGLKIEQYKGYGDWLTVLNVPDYIQQDKPDITNGQNEIKNTIESKLQQIKVECFNNDKDSELFVDLLTKFFEGKKYIIPNHEILLKYRTKTKLAPIFNEIWKGMPYENKANSLSQDLEYFKIIRVLNHFKNSTDQQLYTDITRK